jgi:hypothetical protein
MSGYLCRWPEGFVPEEHGWERADAGAGITVWLRWEPPFRFPASIAECMHEMLKSGAVGGWYMPPGGLAPDVMSLGEIHRELLQRGTGLVEALAAGDREVGDGNA